MSIAFAIYSALVAVVSSLMIYYWKAMYPQQEAKLKEESK
jgi:hypothetical protein